MTIRKTDATREKGVVLVHLAVVLSTLMLFSGVAVDTGRAYVVKAQLTKAVDGAALGAARMLNSGDPKGAAARIFDANFPDGYMGITVGHESRRPTPISSRSRRFPRPASTW